ncbi:MAG: TIGR01440 family protein [Clostridiales bacterium]|nr:TIGR01440 family protein [Clostridiales bacterium]
METQISTQLQTALSALLALAKPSAGEILVVGCSTSEVMGKRIGSCSSAEIAREIFAVLREETQRAGLYLAVQGCEHINRCLCVSRACAERYNLAPVWVKPHLRAGGALVTAAFENTSDPVMVEDIRAQARIALDIGGTLIGMHLRPVAVPARCAIKQIGEAPLTMAYSRPKYVGGPRAGYEGDAEMHG